jgi:hypothetical protein
MGSERGPRETIGIWGQRLACVAAVAGLDIGMLVGTSEDAREG